MSEGSSERSTADVTITVRDLDDPALTARLRELEALGELQVGTVVAVRIVGGELDGGDAVTALDLDAIEARAAAATPGPWQSDYDWAANTIDIGPAEHDADGWPVGVELVASVWSADADQQGLDAAFLMNAREDVPVLIARIRELEDLQVLSDLRIGQLEHQVAELVPLAHIGVDESCGHDEYRAFVDRVLSGEFGDPEQIIPWLSSEEAERTARVNEPLVNLFRTARFAR